MRKYGSSQFCCGSCALVATDRPGHWPHGSRCEGHYWTGPPDTAETIEARGTEVRNVEAHLKAALDIALAKLLEPQETPVEDLPMADEEMDVPESAGMVVADEVAPALPWSPEQALALTTLMWLHEDTVEQDSSGEA